MDKKPCKKCGQNLPIENSHFQLCRKCNKVRLDERKPSKQQNTHQPSIKSLREPKNTLKKQKRISISAPVSKTKKKLTMIERDEIFYEECFNLSDHKCEECGIDLPDYFRNEDGKVAARFRYSHIVPKSISAKLRHDTRNINHLCLKHHVQWDFGDKKTMKIYAKNKAVFHRFF